MTAEEKVWCDEWCKAHARKWQVLNRSQWKYVFREKTLVRYVDEVQLRENEITLLLKYLSSDDCIATLSLYDQTIDASWKPTRAWLEVASRSVGSVHGVRLYHGLMTQLGEMADGPYVVENGCASKVTFTYYWRQPTVMTVPASTSGVHYRISGLSRDPDTGLYTYALEKLERVQQDIAEYLTATTIFEDRKEEEHIGVKQDNVATTGKQASVGNGKIVRRKISKNSDCTSNVSNDTIQEKKVVGASESIHVGLTGTTKTVTNRNMPSKAEAPTEVGESVENSETEGGLWNQTIRTIVRGANLLIRNACRNTIFAHSHGKTNVQSEDPGFEHSEEAGGGRIVEKSVSRTSDGAYEVHEQVTEEKPVVESSESIHVGLTGVTRTVTNRNMGEKAEAPTEVGESVENARTDGGLWNQTIRTLVHGAMLKIAESCRKTIFVHAHGTRKVQSDDPGFTHVESATGGVIVDKSVSRTSDGSYEIHERNVQELPVSKSARSARMTLNGLEVTEESRNQSEPLSESGLKVGESVSNSKTDGGLWNTRRTTGGAEPAGNINESCGRDFFTHGHTKVENKAEAESPETSFEKGKIVRKTSALNGNGTANVTTSEENAVSSKHKYSYIKLGYKIDVWKYRNQPESGGGINVPNNDTDAVEMSEDINRFGLYDGTIVIRYGVGKSGVGDLKFNKQTARISFYTVRKNPLTRFLEHMESVFEIRRIRGGAYTDYLSDLSRVNPFREKDGVLAVKLHNTYRDKDGNLLAEWSVATGQYKTSNTWVRCNRECMAKHGAYVQNSSSDFAFLVSKYMNT